MKTCGVFVFKNGRVIYLKLFNKKRKQKFPVLYERRLKIGDFPSGQSPNAYTNFIFDKEIDNVCIYKEA